jgi:hypothetical protein
MQPHDRLSPKAYIDPASLRVAHTSSDGAWSIAEFNWWEGNAWVPYIGIAWNGDLNNPKDVGWPNSRNQGTWFCVPPALAPFVKAYAQSMAILAAATGRKAA